MTVWRLIGKEILHRKLNFVLGVVSVLIAAGVVVGQFTLLRAYDVCTEEILARKQAADEVRLAKLEDDYRKYMKELGFNLLILPKDQDLAEYWAKGYATHTMPEEYVHRLATASGPTVIRHLLPVVQQRVLWPEQKRRIILIGTRGEVPLAHRNPKEPMLLAVPKGQVVMGYELARDLGLKVGDAIQFMGRKFTIQKVRPERGTAEDATIWMDLPAAQELLNMTGRINGIEALKCHCAGVSPEKARRIITSELDDKVRVVLRENKVTLRAKARDRARREHVEAMAALKASRARLRRTRESLASVVVPLVLIGSAVWVGLLALSNVRERSAEIGILRAIGVGSRRIFTVFLAKAVLIGLLGALGGYALGLGVSMFATQHVASLRIEHPAKLFVPLVLAGVLVAAPIISVLASWAPATLAARQDPAVILSRE
ncbi:MAG: FtsX-like permease family protein [Planctomycetes bacterium]|nr:FtsX-like permease family protein [Planctomycetota bacterium]